jgi:hypothetical protein
MNMLMLKEPYHVAWEVRTTTAASPLCTFESWDALERYIVAKIKIGYIIP